MRLWHTDLISYLPSVKDYKGCSNQLGGQHTEIRMILGSILKHGKVNHSTVNYVNHYPISNLYAYGLIVVGEMKHRGFNINENIELQYRNDPFAVKIYNDYIQHNIPIFKEHDLEYMKECLDNLKGKGIDLIASNKLKIAI